MEDGQGTVLTLDHERDLCDRCRAKLQASGYALRVPASDIWQ